MLLVALKNHVEDLSRIADEERQAAQSYLTREIEKRLDDVIEQQRLTRLAVTHHRNESKEGFELLMKENGFQFENTSGEEDEIHMWRRGVQLLTGHLTAENDTLRLALEIELDDLINDLYRDCVKVLKNNIQRFSDHMHVPTATQGLCLASSVMRYWNARNVLEDRDMDPIHMVAEVNSVTLLMRKERYVRPMVRSLNERLWDFFTDNTEGELEILHDRHNRKFNTLLRNYDMSIESLAMFACQELRVALGRKTDDLSDAIRPIVKAARKVVGEYVQEPHDVRNYITVHRLRTTYVCDPVPRNAWLDFFFKRPTSPETKPMEDESRAPEGQNTESPRRSRHSMVTRTRRAKTHM